jgi:putative ABC transport system ATP-binding protein
VLDLLDRVVRARGKTLLVVTHSAEVARRADRVLHLRDGALVEGHDGASVERRDGTLEERRDGASEEGQ